jgi:hypothetical protein
MGHFHQNCPKSLKMTHFRVQRGYISGWSRVKIFGGYMFWVISNNNPGEEHYPNFLEILAHPNGKVIMIILGVI